MTSLRAEILPLLMLAVGCGIAQRTVDETKAEDGGSGGGGGAMAVAGQATAGMQTSPFGGAGGMMGNVGTAASAGTAEMPRCAAAGNPAPLRRLSRWEYRRSVTALTGVTTSTVGVDALADEPREGPFSFAMSWNAASAGYVLAEAERQGMAARDGRLLPCDVTKPVDGACASAFVDTFVGRAFRRPLSDAERSRYVSLFKLGSSSGDMAAGAELVVEAALFSPIFLHKIYFGNGGGSVGQTPLTGFELASRMSFLFAGEPPDAALWEAAAHGDLATPEGVEASARRLLGEPSFRDAVTHFHGQWLDLDQLDNLVSASLPAELRSAMRADTERFVVDVFLRERTLPALLQSNRAFVDARLAPRYDVAAPPQDFAEVALDATRYYGVLTRASTLTRFNNPTQRGKFVRERLLCGLVPPPPPQIPKLIEVLPGQTRRQAYQQHVTQAPCAACHQLMDDIGFGFENFDEVGLYRTTDNGLPVDAVGALSQTGDIDGHFTGVGELAAKLSQSTTVGECLTKTWLSYALQRLAGDGDECAVAKAYAAFVDAKLDMGELLVALAVSSQFRSRDAFFLPMPAPFMGVSGSLDTVQMRHKLLLDNAIGELQWLKNGGPKEDLMMLDQYLTGLRDLESQLSQVGPTGPAPGQEP